MIKLYNFDELKPEEILNRDIRAEKNVEDVVDGIIADVRARGDEALKDYALKFDGAVIENLQVTQEEIDEAFAGMDPYFLETLRQAAANIENFHRQQVHKNFVVNDKPGIVLGQKYTPIEKAGVYVPGGTAAYPSTVLMDVIPAKVAGVWKNGALTLWVDTEFTRAMLNKPAILQALSQAASTCFGVPEARVSVVVGQPPASQSTAQEPAAQPQAGVKDALDELLAFGAQFDNIKIQ